MKTYLAKGSYYSDYMEKVVEFHCIAFAESYGDAAAKISARMGDLLEYVTLEECDDEFVWLDTYHYNEFRNNDYSFECGEDGDE